MQLQGTPYIGPMLVIATRVVRFAGVKRLEAAVRRARGGPGGV
jgi:hypothetical protein